MFRFRRSIASARARTPYSAALEALDRGDCERAEAELTTLLASEVTATSRAFVLNKRGVARIRMARTSDARSDFEAALACAPRYAPALTNLGNLLLEEGATDAAIARYEEAISADPDYALAHFNLGAAYKRAGRLSEGVRALRRAQQLEGPSGGKRRLL